MNTINFNKVKEMMELQNSKHQDSRGAEEELTSRARLTQHSNGPEKKYFNYQKTGGQKENMASPPDERNAQKKLSNTTLSISV